MLKQNESYFSERPRLANVDVKISYSSTVAHHSSARTRHRTGAPIMINGGCQCPQEASVQRFLHILTRATSKVDASQQWIPAELFLLCSRRHTRLWKRFGFEPQKPALSPNSPRPESFTFHLNHWNHYLLLDMAFIYSSPPLPPS